MQRIRFPRHRIDSITPSLSFLQTTPRYSSKVLVGNWFNERFKFSDPAHRQAIVPAIYAPNECLKVQSQYKENYVNLMKNATHPSGSFQTEQAAQRFRNMQRNRGSSILLRDAKSFVQNCTTTQDIFYRLRPALDEFRGEPRPRAEHNIQNEDLTRSYGNKTNFGLRQWKQCVAQNKLNAPVGISTYNDAYRAPKAFVQTKLEHRHR